MNEPKRSAFSKPAAEKPIHERTPQTDSRARIYKPDPADTSTLPDKIKVDLETPLEAAMWVVMGAAAFIAFLLYSRGTTGGKNHIPAPELLKYVPIFIGIMVIAFICRLFMDNYYILNIAARKIFYHFKFFFEVKITPFADFESIYAIGVTGIRHTHKGSVWWKYKICAVKNNGEFIDLSDEAAPAKLDDLNQKAKGMAAVVGCLFAEGAAQSKIVFTNGNSGSQMIYFETDEQIQPQLKDIKLSGAFFVVITVIIALFCLMMFALLKGPK